MKLKHWEAIAKLTIFSSIVTLYYATMIPAVLSSFIFNATLSIFVIKFWALSDFNIFFKSIISYLDLYMLLNISSTLWPYASDQMWYTIRNLQLIYFHTSPLLVNQSRGLYLSYLTRFHLYLENKHPVQ